MSQPISVQDIIFVKNLEAIQRLKQIHKETYEEFLTTFK